MDALRTDHRIDLEITTEPGGAIVAAGEIDIATAPALERALAAAGERPVVVDLSGITFMDSSGVALLVDHAVRRDVIVRAVSSPVLRTLRIAGALHS